MVQQIKRNIARLKRQATRRPAEASLSDLHPRRKAVTMAGVLLAMLLAALDQTIVGTALPRIVADLGGADQLAWVVTAYMLGSTVTVPIYGKLSDMYGRKWFFFSGIIIFLIASVLSGLSQNMLQLIAFRALQGIGGGAIMGNAFAIIGDLFEAKERAKWQGLMGGVFGLSSVIGPALGGWLTDNASWRYVFYINIPLSLVAAAFIGLLMPAIMPHIKDKKIDFAGAGLLITTLVPLLLALSWGGVQYDWNSAAIISLFVVAAASLVGLLFVERRVSEPIIALDLFKNGVFSVSVIVSFLTAAAMFGAIVYIPLFAQLVQGVSATASGTILTPMMIALVSGSLLSGQIISRIGKYKPQALAGGILLPFSLFWLSRLSADASTGDLIMRMVALGLSLGLTLPVFTIAVQNAFDKRRLGVVTAATQLFRNVGGTVGIALLGVVFSNVLAEKALNLGGTAFAQSAAARQQLDVTNVNTMQGLLSVQGREKAASSLQQLPQPARQPATAAFEAYISQARRDFTEAINLIFFISAALAAVAAVVTLFLKEIPMGGSRKMRGNEHLTEAGEELAVGMGQANPEHEPELPLKTAK